MFTGPLNYSSEYPRLLADIGGTNARFALEVEPGRLDAICVLLCADYPSLCAAMQSYLDRVTNMRIMHAALGVANPVIGDQVQMTNHHWSFSIDETRHTMRLSSLVVINDFTALALALPQLPSHELLPLGGEEPAEGAAIGLIGPGTGLGVSGLLPTTHGYVAISGEGGHVSFSPFDEEESNIWQYARARYGHVSAERLLSGPGLTLIHEALTANEAKQVESLSAEDITRRALTGECERCYRSTQVFLALLGTAASNLALTLGARGGVYIGGGIVPRLTPLLPSSPLRSRFEDKGRFRDYLAPIPLYVINSAYPALLGVSAALTKHLESV